MTVSFLVSVLVFLIIIGLIFWCVGQLSSAFAIPQPIVTVIYVVLVVIVIVYLLQYIGGPMMKLR